MSILLITGATKGLRREAARRLLEDARMTHAFLPLLERSDNAAIVNVSSGRGD
jgi:NAD(P)-dependent dehydrogenase (short-subunit alcohol dehydrogenase family)